MLRVLVLLGSVCALGLTCLPSPPPPLTIEPLARPVGFCVVCHSCYNAACQLKLSSYEGVSRGGSKQAVYSSSRLEAQRPRVCSSTPRRPRSGARSDSTT